MKNGSDRLLGSQVMEWNASRMRNTTSWETLSCHVKWTHVLAKRQLESWQRQLGKTGVVKGRAYIVSSLILKPPPFFVLQFVFSIIHGSGRHSALPRPCTILNANRRTKNGEPKNKKQGRPGNEAILCLWTERQPYTNWKLVKLSFLKNTYRYQAVHSNAFPYFTDLAVSSSL